MTDSARLAEALAVLKIAADHLEQYRNYSEEMRDDRPGA